MSDIDVFDLNWLDENCPSVKSDGIHCRHWWDGEECHWCHAPEMPMEEKVAHGMVEGPIRNPNG